MVLTYRKGVHYEREFMNLLESKGFACLRVASSGSYHAPFDVLGLKKGRVFVFEIKAWKREPHMSKERERRIKEWCGKSGALAFLVWRGKKKLLLRKVDEKNWMSLDTFLSIYS